MTANGSSLTKGLTRALSINDCSARMTSFAKLTSVFERLKAIMLPYAANLAIKRDTPTKFYVDTRYVQKNGKPLFFGAVQINQGYASYNLMPVYMAPELLKNASKALKRRMQDKSCFNFTEIDEGLFRELAALTKSAYASFKERGFV